MARREELTAAIPDLLDDSQLMEALELGFGDWRRAREVGLTPEPEQPPYWTRTQADVLAERAGQLREEIPPQPGALLGQLFPGQVRWDRTTRTNIRCEIRSCGSVGVVAARAW